MSAGSLSRSRSRDTSGAVAVGHVTREARWRLVTWPGTFGGARLHVTQLGGPSGAPPAQGHWSRGAPFRKHPTGRSGAIYTADSPAAVTAERPGYANDCRRRQSLSTFRGGLGHAAGSESAARGNGKRMFPLSHADRLTK